MEQKVSLSGKARDTFARVVEHLLAEECSLSATTQEYRWKVSGPNFHSLHKLFDEQRRQLDHWLGLLFQRTKAAGLQGSLVVESSSKQALPGNAETPPPMALIDDLLNRHEEMSRKLRENVEKLGDPGTAELFRRLADFHDTTAWMLRMLLQEPGSRTR